MEGFYDNFLSKRHENFRASGAHKCLLGWAWGAFTPSPPQGKSETTCLTAGSLRLGTFVRYATLIHAK